MVYVGGTDSGRFIPTLLNETTEGESHIVLTQNALADGTYLDYLRYLYGDRLSTLSGNDSQSSFTTYLQDAQKRLQHDQDNPDDPRQILPGEDIQKVDNRVQVSGQVAVMQINELLLKALMQKNPDLSFALEESFPLKTLYATASTLGPISELSADSSNSLTVDRAAQSLDYWRSTTDALLADPDSSSSTTVRNTYSKMIVSQANLFLNHNLSAEAEQAYQYAANLSPSQPEVVFGYTNLLLNQKRYAEATQLAQTAVNLAPDNAQFQGLLAQVSKLK
jgi:tetratricopeptide (TPR) repeat protein